MAISALELFWLPPTLMPLLSGCASFQIVSPAQDAITGNPTTVHVTAYPQMNQLSVSLDQTNITNKILTNTTDGVGQVNVTPGPHTVAATAIVEPKILTPYNGTDSKQFCASQPRQAIKTVTPFAFASSNTWVNGTNGVSLGPDATDGSTRWWLADALPNSATNHSGQIKWGGAPDCRCIASDDTLPPHSAPPASYCDPTIGANINPTPAQQKLLWESHLVQSVGNKSFYSFASFAANLCLSERAGRLTQENCDLSDNSQLWTLRDNKTGMFSNDPNPWFIDPYP